MAHDRWKNTTHHLSQCIIASQVLFRPFTLSAVLRFVSRLLGPSAHNSFLNSSDRYFIVYWTSTFLPEMPVTKRNRVPNLSPDAIDQSPSTMIKLLGKLASLDDFLDDSLDES